MSKKYSKGKSNRKKALTIIGGTIVVSLLFLFILQFLNAGMFSNTNAAPKRYIDKVFTSVKVTKDIKYATVGSKSLLLDIIEPTGDTLTKRPVMVLVHGGGFLEGSKADWGGEGGFAYDYTKSGYVTVPINYRLLRNRPFSLEPDFISDGVKMAREDTMAAIRWLRANATKYRLDPDKIIVNGYSAGAMTALYTAYDTANVGNSGTPGYSSKINGAVSMSGGMLQQDLAKIQVGEAPSLLFHGEKDSIVPIVWSKRVEGRLDAVGIYNETVYYPGTGHSLAQKLPEVKAKTLAFCYKVLKLDQTTPPVTPPPVTPPGIVPKSGRYVTEIFSDIVVEKNIKYGNADNKNLYLDIYQPKNDNIDKRPVLILVHGGGFVGGSKAVWGSDIKNKGIAPSYAKRGYFVIANDYRLLRQTGGIEENLKDGIRQAREDTMAAIRWARANATKYKLDINKIAVGGSSAGAVTALYTVYDTADVGKSGNPDQSSRATMAFSFAGGMYTGDYELIEKGEPPAILFHGEDDPIVSVEYARNVDKKLKEVGIPYEAHYYPGVKHGVISEPGVHDKLISFLYRYLIQSTTVIPPITPPPINPPPQPPPTTKLKADANGDGKVDKRDLIICMENRGKKVTKGASQGDFNDDGKVDIADVLVWLKEWK